MDGAEFMNLTLDPVAPSVAVRSPWMTQVDSISPADWTGELGAFLDATVYQTHEYGHVSWGKAHLSHFLLKRDGKTAATAQVRIVKTPIFPAGIAYVRWAPLFRLRNDDWNLEVFRQALLGLRQEYMVRRRLMLRVIPNIYQTDSCAEAARQVLSELGFNRVEAVRAYHTSRVDLGASVEQLRKGLRQRWRNKLKHAEAEGFSITVGTSDIFYAKFHRAYDEMMTRKRFDTTVSVKEFAQLQSLLPNALKMRVLLCEKDGIVFNALVIAAAGDTGIYLLAATSDAGLAADGAFLLQWQAVQMLKSEGYRWYDLGGINPEGNPGVYQFKSGMGGKDTAQLGLFEICANPLSAITVRAAEAAKSARGHFKHWLSAKPKRPSTGEKPPLQSPQSVDSKSSQ